MARRRKRSRKRSAASSTAARRREPAVVYLDESINSIVLRDRLRGLGVAVQHAGGAFPVGTADAVWLHECGQRGWIVLSRDQRIRRRRLEIEALRAAGVAAFVFTGGQATADDTASVIETLLRKMLNIASSEPRPFLYTFGMGQKLSKAQV